MRVFLAVIILAVIAVLITCAFLFAPNWLPIYLQSDLDLRVSIAQLPIAIASMAALFLAAWEFRQAQKMPKLRVAIRKKYSDDLIFERNQEIPLSLSFPDIDVLLEVFIDNNGEAAARFIKLSFVVSEEENLLEPTIKTIDNSLGWKRNSPSRIDFNGGDDFIVYSHSKKNSGLEKWADCAFR